MPRNSQLTSPTLPGGKRLRIDTDHHLQEMMQAAISRMHRGAIDLQLTDEMVLLRGSVNSWTEKQNAQECIRSLSSSRMIQNDLQVAGC